VREPRPHLFHQCRSELTTSEQADTQSVTDVLFISDDCVQTGCVWSCVVAWVGGRLMSYSCVAQICVGGLLHAVQMCGKLVGRSLAQETIWAWRL